MRVTRAFYFSAAALLYAIGLAVITLTPINQWRFIPQAPWEYLFSGWPRYWTGFDLMVNIMAYTPLGLLLARAIAQKREGPWVAFQAFIAATFLTAMLSVTLEGLQTYLPSRRASLLDVSANSLGGAIGAFLAGLYLQRQKKTVFTQDLIAIEMSALGLLVMWFIAQAAPQSTWLALGGLISSDGYVPMFSWFSANVDLSAAGSEAFTAQHILAEALCVASGLLSFGLLLHLMLLQSPRSNSWYQTRHWLITLIAAVFVTLLVRAVWVALLLSPTSLDVWFTSGVQAGMILALLSAYGLAGIHPRHQRIAALIGIVTMIVLANSLPENLYAQEAFSAWSKGRWSNLQALATLCASAWPFLALTWMGLAARGVGHGLKSRP